MENCREDPMVRRERRGLSQSVSIVAAQPAGLHLFDYHHRSAAIELEFLKSNRLPKKVGTASGTEDKTQP